MTMVQEGDRIELVATSDPYTQLDPGDEGTVTGTRMMGSGITGGPPERKIQVDWDSGSSLSLIQGEDSYKRIDN